MALRRASGVSAAEGVAGIGELVSCESVVAAVSRIEGRRVDRAERARMCAVAVARYVSLSVAIAGGRSGGGRPGGRGIWN